MKVVKVRGPRKNSENRRNNLEGGRQVVQIPRRFHLRAFHEFMNVTMKYIPLGGLNNVGLLAASRQFIANGLYDVDPALGSTAVPGFVEWMSIYQRYRVKKVKAVVDFINLDTSPVVVNLGFDQQFFAANGKTIGFLAGPHQVTRLIAALGGNPVRLSMKRDLQQLLGDVSLLSEDNYAGLVGANPVLPLYVSVAISADGTGVALINGVFMRMTIEFETEFYQLRNLS